MQFDRVKLLAALSAAAPALAKSNSVAGLDHFWFDGDYIYAYDGGLGVRVEFKTNLECGVPGKPLLNLLKTSALKEVSLEEGGDSGPGLIIEMGKGDTHLVSMAWDRFGWAFPEGWGKKSGASGGYVGALSLTEGMLDAFTRVGFVRYSGKDDKRTVYHGALVHPAGDSGTLELYATDAASIVRVRVSDAPPAGLEDFVAPWAFVDRFLELAVPGKSTLFILEQVTIAKEEVSCLVVDSPGVRVYSNLLDLPEEPNVPKRMEPFIRGEDDKFAELPAGLQAAMERALILAGQDDVDAKEALVKVEVDGKALYVTGKYKLGSVDEEFQLKAALRASASGLFKARVVRQGLGQATGFNLTDEAFIIDDGEDISYVMASRHERTETKRGKGKKKEEPPEEEEAESDTPAPRRGGVARRQRAEPEPEAAPRKRPRRGGGGLDDGIPF